MWVFLYLCDQVSVSHSCALNLNFKHDTVGILHLSLHVGSTEGPQAMYTLLLGHLCSVRRRYVYTHSFRTPHNKWSIVHY